VICMRGVVYVRSDDANDDGVCTEMAICFCVVFRWLLCLLLLSDASLLVLAVRLGIRNYKAFGVVLEVKTITV